MTQARPNPGDAKDEGAPPQRLEHVLAMSARLADAIAADIAALEKGRFDALRTADPDIERLCFLYGREVAALKASGGVGRAPKTIIAELRQSGTRLKGLLLRHEKLVGAMRQASEGLFKAIGEEVEKSRRRVQPYSAVPRPKRDLATGAVVYNKVV
jgi:hypothetical protein